MKDNSDKDRELLDNLDRILEGREDEVSEVTDEDIRSATEFARKMASMREKPSDEFAENLKAVLIHRLAEQENKQGSRDQELLFWGVPRRKLWQGTLAALIALIIIAIIFIVTLLLD
ncbi:MAG: hypothetical protein A2158_08280 [Chloroflexi bacterium RBG_13_46_14]|nr:MAG: hypothetical protein A2158_08280 [Chloroflexi bacterium RBG_13_46_14]